MSWYGGIDASSWAPAAASYFGGERRNKTQEQQAQQQIDFQRDMSNTAYQRSMADMKKAGINPILAAKLNPASTPPGSMAIIEDSITAGINTGLQASQTAADTDKKEQETAILELDKRLKEAVMPTIETIDGIIEKTNKFFDTIKSGQAGESIYQQAKKVFMKITGLKAGPSFYKGLNLDNVPQKHKEGIYKMMPQEYANFLRLRQKSKGKILPKSPQRK